MAPPKRKNSPGAQRIAAKRAKVSKEAASGAAGAGTTISLGAVQTDEGEKGRIVDVNQLPWDSIDDMLDLQVVEGVEVIKEGDGVKFVLGGQPNVKGVSSVLEGKKKKKVKRKAEEVEGEKTEEKTEEKKGDKKPKKEQKKKNDKKSVPTAEPDSEATASFNVLSNLPDDDAISSYTTAWHPLNLIPDLLAPLAHLQFANPTEIQRLSIPHILAGRDVIGKAATGTGKTLAFGLPILDKWLSQQEEVILDADVEEEGKKWTAENPKTPVALILSPTRELARQISSHLDRVAEKLSPRPYICSVTGGLAVVKQMRQLARADIVVATPGRLWELLSDGGPLLSAFKKIQFLVIDEADRLLADGSFEEAGSILEALDRPELIDGQPVEIEEGGQANVRQTLVFSATLSKALHQKLAGKGRRAETAEEKSLEYLADRLKFQDEDPVIVDVSPAATMAAGLKEGLLQCPDANQKDLYLYALLALQGGKRTLVFTNAIKSCKRLVPFLANLGFEAKALHSTMLQKARLAALEWVAATNNTRPRILVATDVAARGLDIPSMDTVIHYHVPRTADTYVHRSGRTARAQKKGISILICTPTEATATRRLLGKIHDTGKKDALSEIATVQVDPRELAKFKKRVELAKKLADATSVQSRGAKEENWLKKAADELGVVYDSEELSEAERREGKGGGRREKEKQLRGLTKAELEGVRAALRVEMDKETVGRRRTYVPGQEITESESIWWV